MDYEENVEMYEFAWRMYNKCRALIMADYEETLGKQIKETLEQLRKEN